MGTFWMVKQESRLTIFDSFTRACMYARDHRQTTSHGFKDRQTKSILKRRADVGVRGGVEGKNVSWVREKTYSILQPVFSQHGGIQSWVVSTNNQQPKREILDESHRLEKNVEAFVLPIVADQ
jgi:hypothetical protein